MAKNDWMLDVLTDLKSFAQANDLKKLVEQLDDTMLIAAAEIAAKTEEANTPTDAGGIRPGPNPGGVGRYLRA